LIITRDSRIANNQAEIAAVRDSEARMVTLAGPEAVGTWAQLEVLCCQWRAIERRSDQPRPFHLQRHTNGPSFGFAQLTCHRPEVDHDASTAF
jgi:hypothetical protein